MSLLDIASRLEAAFNAGDVGSVLDAMAADVVLVNPMGNSVRGKAEAERWLLGARELGYRIERDGEPQLDGATVMAPVTLAFPDGSSMAAAVIAEFEEGAIVSFQLRGRSAKS